jgi:hypothetical protein
MFAFPLKAPAPQDVVELVKIVTDAKQLQETFFLVPGIAVLGDVMLCPCDKASLKLNCNQLIPGRLCECREYHWKIPVILTALVSFPCLYRNLCGLLLHSQTSVKGSPTLAVFLDVKYTCYLKFVKSRNCTVRFLFKV